MFPAKPIFAIIFSLLLSRACLACKANYVDANDKIVLKVRNKEELAQAIYGFKKIAKNLEEPWPISLLRMKQLTYEIDISSFLTFRIHELLLRTNSYYEGPNCYNTVLYLLKILDYPRYTSDEEFKFYLEESGFFQRVAFDYQVEPGDIGVVVKNKNVELKHSFIFLCDTLVIEKKGYQQEDDYQIAYLEEVLTKYSNYELYYFRCLPQNKIKEKLEPINDILEKLNQMLYSVMAATFSDPIEKLSKIKELLLTFEQTFEELKPQLALFPKLYSKIISFNWEGVEWHFKHLLQVLQAYKIHVNCCTGIEYVGNYRAFYLDKKRNEYILSLINNEPKIIKLRVAKLDLATLDIK